MPIWVRIIHAIAHQRPHRHRIRTKEWRAKESDSSAPILLPFLHLAARTGLRSTKRPPAPEATTLEWRLQALPRGSRSLRPPAFIKPDDAMGMDKHTQHRIRTKEWGQKNPILLPPFSCRSSTSRQRSGLVSAKRPLAPEPRALEWRLQPLPRGSRSLQPPAFVNSDDAMGKDNNKHPGETFYARVKRGRWSWILVLRPRFTASL